MNSGKRILARLLIYFALLASLLFAPISALAAPFSQNGDPAVQCDQGVQLFLQGRRADALPLLEFGFANRANAHFTKMDDLGICALALGVLYGNGGEFNKALDADLVALQIFKDSNNQKYYATLLSNLSTIYAKLGKIAEALDSLQEVLTITKAEDAKEDESKILIQIGMIYFDQEKYDDAEKYYQQALEIAQELSFFDKESTALNNLGNIYLNKKQYPKALEYFQRALTIEQKINYKEGEVGTLSNIGKIRIAQEQYSDALTYYQQSLTIAKEIGDQKTEYIALASLGIIFEHWGQYSKALENYQKALALAIELGDKENEALALRNIADIHSNQGHHANALLYYQKALEMAREIKDRAGEGVTLNSMGTLYEAQGQYTKALENHQQALAIAQKIGNRSDQGYAIHNMGVIYYDQGQYDEALKYYKLALEIRREIHEQAAESTTLGNMGTVYVALGQYDRALEYYQQALEIIQRVGDQPNQGNILSNIGNVYIQQAKYSEALSYFKKSLDILRSIGYRRGEVDALINLGTTQLPLGKHEDALNSLRQALEIARADNYPTGISASLHNIGVAYTVSGRYKEALDTYQQALIIANQVKNQNNEGRTLQEIGWVYQQQNQLTRALEYYEQAISIYEKLRVNVGNQTGRASFIGQFGNIYDNTINLYFESNQPEKAFLVSEHGRARAFLDSMATGQVELNSSTDIKIYETERQKYNARQSVQEMLAQAKAQNPPDEKLIIELETQLFQAEKEYQSALIAITAGDGQLQQLIPGQGKVLDIHQAQNLLDKQTTLLSFWVLDDKTIVFILTSKTFNAVTLPITRKDLYAQIQALRAFSNTDVPYPESAIALYHALIESIKSQLTTRHLVIVPHGELHFLPFGALTDGKRFLVDDYVITDIPSVNTLPFIKDKSNNLTTQQPLFVGNPATKDIKLAPLPFAESEVQSIASLYGVSPFIGGTATESKIKELVSQADILHLAAHGSFNLVNPLYSTIHLTPDGQNDGALEVREIYGLDLHKTNLVVLSACETQLGQLSRGDEWVGLTRAFFFAGTPTVVASLWNVNDEATALLMEQFYTHMRNGMGKAEALRQAQLDVRAKYPNPYYWSGFVLSGDGGAVTDVSPALESQPVNSILQYTLSVILFCCICGVGVAASPFVGIGLLVRRLRKKFS